MGFMGDVWPPHVFAQRHEKGATQTIPISLSRMPRWLTFAVGLITEKCKRYFAASALKPWMHLETFPKQL